MLCPSRETRSRSDIVRKKLVTLENLRDMTWTEIFLFHICPTVGVILGTVMNAAPLRALATALEKVGQHVMTRRCVVGWK